MPITKFARGGVWYIRGTLHGQKVYFSTGFRDEKSAEIARQKEEDRINAEALHGKKATVTFDDAANAYISAGGSDRYLIKYHPRTGKHSGIGEHFKGKLIAVLTQLDLDQAALKLYPKASPETKNRQLYTPFVAVWNYAVACGWVSERKWIRPRKPKGTGKMRSKRAGTTPISYDRAAGFVSAMSPAAAMAMTTLFYTGLRPIELFNLQAEQVNLAGRWMITDSKTGAVRGVPIHEFLVPLLTPLVARGGDVFRTHKGEPWPLSDGYGGQMSSAIDGARRRLKEIGIAMGDVSAYTARHTVSTQLVVNGVHPHIKDQILGHAATDMSRHYTQVPQKELIDAINTLPVPALWREMEWLSDPLYWSRRLVAYGDEGKEQLANKLRLHGFDTCSKDSIRGIME